MKIYELLLSGSDLYSYELYSTGYPIGLYSTAEDAVVAAKQHMKDMIAQDQKDDYSDTYDMWIEERTVGKLFEETDPVVWEESFSTKKVLDNSSSLL